MKRMDIEIDLPFDCVRHTMDEEIIVFFLSCPERLKKKLMEHFRFAWGQQADEYGLYNRFGQKRKIGNLIIIILVEHQSYNIIIQAFVIEQSKTVIWGGGRQNYLAYGNEPIQPLNPLFSVGFMMVVFLVLY